MYNTFYVHFLGLFTDDVHRVLYRLTGIETVSGWPLCPNESNWIKPQVCGSESPSLRLRPNHTGLLCLQTQKGSLRFVSRRRSALRFGDGRRVFLGSVPVLGLKQGSGSGSGSGSFHCHPAPAACFLLTRNERGISRLLYGVLSRESIWERMISISLERGGHTCALTAAPLVCMPGRENLVSSFNWTCHANGPPAARGWRAQQAQPHC